MIKRLLTFLIAVVVSFSLAVPVLAVDKKEKNDKKKTSIEKKSESKKKAVTKKQPPRKQSPKKLKAGSKKKYDNFIDRNKNGIDDRVEKKKLKKPSPKKTVKKIKKPKKSITKKKKGS